MYWIVKQAKLRAKEIGVSFDIKDTDITIPTHCPIFGIELSSNSGKSRPNSYSLDRIDSTKGYTKDNVQVISHRANMCKNNMTPEEAIKLAAFMNA